MEENNEETKETVKFTRTDKLIMDAFSSLLEKSPINKISVLDICDKAMIKRATFYNHFESKEHLFNAIIESLKEDLFLSIIENNKNQSIEDMFNQIALNTIDFLVKNKNKLATIINNNKTSDYDYVILESINRSLKFLIKENKDKLNVNIPSEVISRFFSGGLVNLAIWWVTDENTYTKDDLLKIVHNFIEKIVQII
jgi:AcrR family transcriptional regulator